MNKIILPVIICFAASIAACKKDQHQPKPFVTTIAGNGIRGFADGMARYAQFTGPAQMTIDAQGNLYVADPFNHRIRKITPAGIVSTLAGNGTAGYVNGASAVAQFNHPEGIAIDANGNVYVADQRNYKISKITPSAIVSTLAGSGTYGFNDGNGTAAQFTLPTGIACDAQGNVYAGDMQGNRVRKITPAGVVTTFAGSSEGLVEGRGADAKFHAPAGLACDASGNVYVADELNHRIRKITPNGSVTTYAGSEAGFLDGEGMAAKFNAPNAVVIYQGEVYVSDYNNSSIRKIVLQ